jgi:hypothetical protein
MSDLNPNHCPFCGLVPNITNWGTLWKIECSAARTQCAVGPAVAAKTKEEVLRLWNRRPLGDG